MDFLFIYLVFLNILGFLLFGLDKYKAIRDHWRIPEKTLLLFALLGGAPGCLAGMFVFRHKIRKPKFYLLVPIILVLEYSLFAMLFFHNYKEHLPYQQDPTRLVKHELSLLRTSTTDQSELSSDMKQLILHFYEPFSYKITDTTQTDDTATVKLSLETIDGQQLAKEYSRQILIKQIQNTASPSSVDFSLDDCYRLLDKILQTEIFSTVQTECTVCLSRKEKNWHIDNANDFKQALTGNFASHVANARLFTPSEIISIHLDTLKTFDTEQLNRYLALDSLFPGDAKYRRSIAKALAKQLQSSLDYKILSEEISKDHNHATISMELTSYDCNALIASYQKKIVDYIHSSQALEDGKEGRLQKAKEILLDCLTNNTAISITPVVIELYNDGTNWKMEMNDEMTAALIGTISTAVQGIEGQL